MNIIQLPSQTTPAPARGRIVQIGTPRISDKTLALQSGRKGRKEHLAVIRAMKRAGRNSDAAAYWLRECARLISSAAFNAA